MALSIKVRDLEVAPGTEKTVTLDLKQLVPNENEGDEKFVTSAETTAVSKIDGATITPIYLREFKAGYSKSSGAVIPPFDIDSSNNIMNVGIDESAATPIILASGTGLSGDDVARDLEAKISALAATGGVKEGHLGYLNVLVEFANNKFKIISGTVSNSYTGSGRSSVTITSGALNDAAGDLGFDIPTESLTISVKRAFETVLASGYTAAGASMVVGNVHDYAAGEAFTISDGSNREYFVASAVSGTTNTVYISNSGGLSNSYAAGAIVQKIFERDAESELASPYEDIDALVRFQLRSVTNEIDFTS
jgi:hypothetical protein